MTALGSTHAIADRIFEDVANNLAEWQAGLDARRAEAATAFSQRLASMVPPAGADPTDYAEAQIDIVIERWCQRRNFFSRQIVAMFEPETLVACQILGKAAELGQLIGLHLDNAVRDLDRELRELVGDQP